MIIRQATAQDHPAWAEMLARLHPDQSAAEFEAELATLTALPEPYIGFIALDEEKAVGVIDLRVRNYAEGAPDLVAAYIEDLWVEAEHRRSGVARALLAAAEDWAREEGHNWLGSDALIDNRKSHDWHRAAGFEELERLVVFGKPLR